MDLSRRPFTAALQTALLMLTWAQGLTAQTAPSPPTESPRLVLGPVNLFPSIVLRDAGIDSNIRNDPDHALQDFTLTAEPRLRAELPSGSTLLTGQASVGLVYYATYKSEQSVNRRVAGRFERTSSRLRPLVAASFNHSDERAGYEIDARVLRRESDISAGGEYKLTGITSLTGIYRHSTQRYGDGEQILEAVLATQLDHATDVAGGGARFAITPLTTVSIAVDVQRDRFDTSTIRDANSVRILPAAEFAPDALITGHIAAGFRQFDPQDPRVKQFRGFVGSANATYTLLGVTRFTVEATRDVDYSFDPTTPYFIIGAARLTMSQRIAGPFDVIATAGSDRLQYQDVEGLPVRGRIDRTRTIGGGLGFRMSRSLRLTLIYDVTERTSSEFDRRGYHRSRLFCSATYGGA